MRFPGPRGGKAAKRKYRRDIKFCAAALWTQLLEWWGSGASDSWSSGNSWRDNSWNAILERIFFELARAIRLVGFLGLEQSQAIRGGALGTGADHLGIGIILGTILQITSKSLSRPRRQWN